MFALMLDFEALFEMFQNGRKEGVAGKENQKSDKIIFFVSCSFPPTVQMSGEGCRAARPNSLSSLIEYFAMFSAPDIVFS